MGGEVSLQLAWFTQLNNNMPEQLTVGSLLVFLGIPKLRQFLTLCQYLMVSRLLAWLLVFLGR